MYVEDENSRIIRGGYVTKVTIERRWTLWADSRGKESTVTKAEVAGILGNLDQNHARGGLQRCFIETMSVLRVPSRRQEMRDDTQRRPASQSPFTASPRNGNATLRSDSNLRDSIVGPTGRPTSFAFSVVSTLFSLFDLSFNVSIAENSLLFFAFYSTFLSHQRLLFLFDSLFNVFIARKPSFFL